MNDPAPQSSLQLDTEVCFDKLLYVPNAQVLHDDFLISSWNFPVAHGLHVDCPVWSW